MIIIGAGLAGLIAAASHFQRARLFEAGSREQNCHKAVLRFRSSAVGDACGVEFRSVVVRKGIWEDGKFVQPNIASANRYARKVVGQLVDRSIWNLDSAQRFIAPYDFMEQLVERVGDRVCWNAPVNNIAEAKELADSQIVSTAPMPVMMKLLGVESDIKFGFAPIVVKRYTISNADVFQTIYFPSPDTPIYRASITGNLVIIEATDNEPTHEQIQDALRAFGASLADVETKDSARQGFGKISPIDDSFRRNFILQATMQHGVYSLGRFATWRPGVLLDDVLEDCVVIKKLIANGVYHAAKSS